MVTKVEHNLADSKTSKIVLVTGSSRGIGAATAVRLASEGYDVCVNYCKDEDAAQDVQAKCLAYGVKAIAVKADISQEEDVVNLFSRIDKELGQIAGLVNNAGILLRQSRVENMTAERMNKVFATNITGYFLCSREAIKRMSTTHGGIGGAIVNVSSAAARIGSAGEYVDYAASKGAIDTLTKGLAIEVAEEGIRVNGVRPGFIYTGVHADGGEPGRVDRIKSTLPMKRGGYPHEVAAAIAWLLSDQASYSTGTFVDVSGGR